MKYDITTLAAFLDYIDREIREEDDASTQEDLEELRQLVMNNLDEEVIVEPLKEVWSDYNRER